MRLLSNSLVLVVGLLALSTAAQAKNKKVKTPAKESKDEIEVVGHIALTNGPVRRFLATQHYSSYYLYVEYAASRSVALVDVTKPTQPSVLADLSFPSNGGLASLFTVAGTAALVTEEQGARDPASATQTIRIMDFSDPMHPKVSREFAGVTAINRDERRGLIYVANAEGLWILCQSFAEDPEVEKAYAHHVLYDH
jgi:hypothetical protein